MTTNYYEIIVDSMTKLFQRLPPDAQEAILCLMKDDLEKRGLSEEGR